MNDAKKPPVRSYETKMRFTPEGTQFSVQQTREGKERAERLQRNMAQKEAAAARQEKTSERFNKFATVKPIAKIKFKRAAKKDRDDFER